MIFAAPSAARLTLLRAGSIAARENRSSVFGSDGGSIGCGVWGRLDALAQVLQQQQQHSPGFASAGSLQHEASLQSRKSFIKHLGFQTRLRVLALSPRVCVVVSLLSLSLLDGISPATAGSPFALSRALRTRRHGHRQPTADS